MSDLGRIGIIANPVAQSGAGTAAANRFVTVLSRYVPESEFSLIFTERAGHAADLACEVCGEYDTLVAIGGDGVVHEVANGLMRIPQEERATMAVVPVGSGNDYALTLGMSHDVEKCVEQILAANARAMDVGCVNGEYFVETLSFGLDAAIALDTVERRKKTGRKGTILYAESGIDQILHHRVPQTYSGEMFDVVPMGRYVPSGDSSDVRISGQSYVFAVQIGRTYGGHFDICPEADPTDGYFDICIAHPPLSAARAVAVFALAKGGHHTKLKMFEFHRTKSLVLDFEQAPPCQADGEGMVGTHFEVSMNHGALNVICGK